MNVNYGDQQLDKQDKQSYDFAQQSYKAKDKRENVGSYEYEDKSDPFTSFVHIDAVLRIQPDGTLISSV